MAFNRPREEKERPPATAAKPLVPPSEKEKSGKVVAKPKAASERLVSLDAFRGLTMLMMASGGLGIARFVHGHEDVLTQFGDKWYAKPWKWVWETAAWQLEHVEWTGCVAWDLIQPSFMFMVGVAMPFSYASRTARGDSWGKQFAHALVRSLILILLGIFLRSTHSKMTNFTFEDVLTQIGLGYLFVFLLLRAPWVAQMVAVLMILGGYWFLLFNHPLPPPEGNLVTRYMSEVRHLPPKEWNQFSDLTAFHGLASHWNKHTNAAAAADRVFLNVFPRPEQSWEGKKFWINGGGYQTLNFVPSMATMIFGLMAGQLLRGPWTQKRKLQALLGAGLVCFVVSMAIDTTIWPFQFQRVAYSFCPIVKRIWTPSWAVFAAGWTIWFLAFWYWLVDICGFRRLVFPLVIIGMNSIAVYCMAELIDGWLGAMFKIHLTAFDDMLHTGLAKLGEWLPAIGRMSAFDWLSHATLLNVFYGDQIVYAPIWREVAVLFLIWLIALWMYRRKIFIRV